MVDLDQFTDREALQILDRALSLIATPDTWIQGDWKCSLYEHNPDGSLVVPRVKKVDAKGNEVFGYCVEGAVNESIIELFGEARARAVGVFRTSTMGDNKTGNEPTEKLSLNTTTRHLFPGVETAMELNDTDLDDVVHDRMYAKGLVYGDDDAWNELWRRFEKQEREAIHSKVLTVLRNKRDELKGRLGK